MSTRIRVGNDEAREDWGLAVLQQTFDAGDEGAQLDVLTGQR